MSPSTPGDAFAEARAGSREALGRALEACRQYLLLVAHQSLDPQLLAKGGASDMVQATFLDAQRDFGKFDGGTEAELRAWLRKMLLHNITDFVRNYRDTDKRDAGREVVLDTREAAGLAADSAQSPTPSREVLAQEQIDQLNRAVARLPEDYQIVLRLRNQEDLPFDVIAQRMLRSENAVRKLWFRAVEQLQQLLDDVPPD
jgi:RNA polymerase sigma-70 factor (ECF subfamily)